MSTTLPARLQHIGPTHDAARLYSRARRNLLPRHERLVAVAGGWQHEHLRRLGVEPEVTLRCGQAGTEPGPATYVISEKTLARLHPGLSAPALLSVVRLPWWRPADVLRPRARLVLVADGIEYAGNLGTLVRTADAAGADGVVLTNADCRLTSSRLAERTSQLSARLFSLVRPNQRHPGSSALAKWILRYCLYQNVRQLRLSIS